MEQRISVLDRLTQGVSARDVRAELAAIRRERERLDLAEQVLSSLIDLLPPEESEAGEDAPDAPDEQTSVEPTAAPPSPGSNREAILAVMAADPVRTWTAQVVRSALEERGVEMTPENLRVTLRRMAKRGELEKPGQGQFRLPREDDAPERSPANLRRIVLARSNPSLMDPEGE